MSLLHDAENSRPAPETPGKDGASVILVGVDDSRTSRRAVSYALGLARRQQARLVVAHVIAPLNCYAVAACPDIGMLANSRDDAELRRELAGEARSAGVTTEYVSVFGEACSELRKLAVDRRAEVLVVGASESWRSRLAGSVSTRLIRTRELPVVVVP